MNINLSKFGTTLTSREAGKEAFSAFKPSLKDISNSEILEVDLIGVITFSPSWGDEFLRPLIEQYNDRVFLKNTQNPSVQATLAILERANNLKFQIR